MFSHRVEDDLQLAHAGCEGEFLRLASSQHPLVDVTDDRIEAAGYQRSHIQGGAHSGTSTPDAAPSSHLAAVPVEGSHSHQGGYLSAVERAQLKQVSQKGVGELLTHTGNAAQQVVLLSPQRTPAKCLPQIFIQVVQLLLQPADVRLYAGTGLL